MEALSAWPVDAPHQPEGDPELDRDDDPRSGARATTSTVAIILAGCAVLSVTIFGGYAVVFSTAPMVRAYQRRAAGSRRLGYGVCRSRLEASVWQSVRWWWVWRVIWRWPDGTHTP